MITPDAPLAYIDPGSGSLLIQVIIGTILAVPFFLRTRIARVYDVLRNRAPTAQPDPSREPTDGGA